MSEIIDIVRSNPETGEAVHARYEGKYRIKLTNLNSLASYRLLRNGNIDGHKGERYIKYYVGRIDLLLEEKLSPKEALLLLAVQSFSANIMHTGEILHPDLSPVTTEQLCIKAGVETSRGRAALSKLISRGIIDRERRGRGYLYYANPFIFVSGNSIAPKTFERFMHTKWANTTSLDESSEVESINA